MKKEGERAEKTPMREKQSEKEYTRSEYGSHGSHHAYAHESDGETPTGRKAKSKA